MPTEDHAAAVSGDSPPLFFLSYARTPTPVSASPSGSDPDKLVFEFFSALNAQVCRLSGRRNGETVGFVEHAGDWPGTVAAALASCRVFVPLCSPRYFASKRCGQEWHAFSSRPGDPAGAIVPTLWAPVPTSAQPVAFRGLPVEQITMLQPDVPDGDRYVKEGLYGLMALEENNSVYAMSVRSIAERVVSLARRGLAAPVSREDLGDLSALPDAFAASSPPRLSIAVLAPTADRLPPDRDPTWYGASALDWRPYGGGTPLAERVAGLARNLGFAPDVGVFDSSSRELLDPSRPTSPWVLILDPWALHDEEVAALVRRFDAGDRPWATVLTPLAVDDPQTASAESRLRRLVSAALPRRLALSRMLHRGAASGIPTAEAFGRLFAELAESAGLQFLRGAQIAVPSGAAALTVTGEQQPHHTPGRPGSPVVDHNADDRRPEADA